MAFAPRLVGPRENNWCWMCGKTNECSPGMTDAAMDIGPASSEHAELAYTMRVARGPFSTQLAPLEKQKCENYTFESVVE